MLLSYQIYPNPTVDPILQIKFLPFPDVPQP